MCFFYLIDKHPKFLLHTLQALYMCNLCDSTNINTILEFVSHLSRDGFNGGADSYLQFRDTQAPCLLKLCITPSNGIVRWWLFPEFGAELQLDNCTPTIILNNPVFITPGTAAVPTDTVTPRNRLKSSSKPLSEPQVCQFICFTVPKKGVSTLTT